MAICPNCGAYRESEQTACKSCGFYRNPTPTRGYRTGVRSDYSNSRAGNYSGNSDSEHYDWGRYSGRNNDMRSGSSNYSERDLATQIPYGSGGYDGSGYSGGYDEFQSYKSRRDDGYGRSRDYPQGLDPNLNRDNHYSDYGYNDGYPENNNRSYNDYEDNIVGLNNNYYVDPPHNNYDSNSYGDVYSQEGYAKVNSGIPVNASAQQVVAPQAPAPVVYVSTKPRKKNSGAASGSKSHLAPTIWDKLLSYFVFLIVIPSVLIGLVGGILYLGGTDFGRNKNVGSALNREDSVAVSDATDASEVTEASEADASDGDNADNTDLDNADSGVSGEIAATPSSNANSDFSATPSPTSTPITTPTPPTSAPSASGEAGGASPAITESSSKTSETPAPADVTTATPVATSAAASGPATKKPAKLSKKALRRLFKEGLAAYNRGSYPQAFDSFCEAAQNGYAPAEYKVGMMCISGEGVEKDCATGLGWFRSADKHGYKQAAYGIGYCYELGKGVEEDLNTATRWYYKAAKAGNRSGQYRLGRCYEQGIGVKKDLRSACSWYHKAAKQGHKEAERSLHRLGY